MAKKSNISSLDLVSIDKAPKDLSEHPFFGITLSEEQKIFANAIWNKDNLIVFCNAYCGTGKTLISTAVAELLYKYGFYENGIVYCISPYAEQKQGFLPGGIEEKSEPYFTPFYQALTKLGINPLSSIRKDITAQKNGAYIDLVPHTFLRGHNFENQIVILDEAQNFTKDELKKTLTRCSDSCKVIVIGHIGQIDLENPNDSGFEGYLKWFKKEPYCQVCELTQNFRGKISAHADKY